MRARLPLRCPCPPLGSLTPAGLGAPELGFGFGFGLRLWQRCMRGSQALPLRPSALPPFSPSHQPVTPLCGSTSIGRHHPPRLSLLLVGPFPARGGAATARTGTRGRPPGWAGGAGRVTWAGGRWSAGAGRRGAAGGHFGGPSRPPPSPDPGAACQSILWPQLEKSPPSTPRLRCSQPESLSRALSALHLPPHKPD